jgi:hypothetical protein
MAGETIDGETSKTISMGYDVLEIVADRKQPAGYILL